MNGPIKPHTSTDEYNYMQGIAAQIKFSRWLLTPFWSFRQLDATLGCHHIEGIKKDGMHRLDREEEKRNRANLITSGVHLSYGDYRYRIGVTGVWHHFGMRYDPPLREYNRYGFRGSDIVNLSCDYQFRTERILLRGETGVSHNGGVATMNALQTVSSGIFMLTLIQRYYAKDYFSWFAKSFSEGSDLSNETGVYVGMVCKPGRNIQLGGGFDFFRFPGVKYGINAPSSGVEGVAQFSYRPNDRIQIAARYRMKKKDKNNTQPEAEEWAIESYRKHTGGISLRSNLWDQFLFKTFADGTYYRFGSRTGSKGGVIGQTFGFRASSFPLQSDLSVAIFETDDTASKIYVQEKTILYGFGSPSFYGNGVRYSATFRYDPLKFVSLWLKVANTRYFDRTEIGADLEKIKGKSKTDLWTQLRIKF